MFCFEIRGMLPDEIQICFYDTSLNTAYSASIDNHLLNEVRELKGFNLSAWRHTIHYRTITTIYSSQILKSTDQKQSVKKSRK